MRLEIESFEVFHEDENCIELRGMNADGICVGHVSVSLKFRGWCIGGRSHFSSSRGLTKVSSNGRGWKVRLIDEAKLGLIAALR